MERTNALAVAQSLEREAPLKSSLETARAALRRGVARQDPLVKGDHILNEGKLEGQTRLLNRGDGVAELQDDRLLRLVNRKQTLAQEKQSSDNQNDGYGRNQSTHFIRSP